MPALWYYSVCHPQECAQDLGDVSEAPTLASCPSRSWLCKCKKKKGKRWNVVRGILGLILKQRASVGDQSVRGDSATLTFDREYCLSSVMAGLGCADGKEKERTMQK